MAEPVRHCIEVGLPEPVEPAKCQVTQSIGIAVGAAYYVDCDQINLKVQVNGRYVAY